LIQAIAGLMFQFCGMSFADLAHLEKSALDQNILRYYASCHPKGYRTDSRDNPDVKADDSGAG